MRTFLAAYQTREVCPVVALVTPSQRHEQCSERIVGYSEATTGCEPRRTSADPSVARSLHAGQSGWHLGAAIPGRILIRSLRKTVTFVRNTNAPRRSERRKDTTSVVGAWRRRRGQPHRRCCLLGYGFRGVLRGSFFFRYGLANHLHLDVRGHFAMQPDSHFVIAQRLDRLVE
jgi:hypothetical protein